MLKQGIQYHTATPSSSALMSMESAAGRTFISEQAATAVASDWDHNTYANQQQKLEQPDLNMHQNSEWQL